MTPLLYKQYAPRVIARQLKRFLNEKNSVLTSPDIEVLHRLRVSSRRLRNSLWTFRKFISKNGYKKIRGGLRSITKSLGEARDLDTAIAFLKKSGSGFEALIPALKQRRKIVQKRVCSSIAQLEKNNTLGLLAVELQKMDKALIPAPALRSYAEKRISRRLKELMFFEKYADQPRRYKKLHEMRIAAKHLRYTLENFEEYYGKEIDAYITEAHRLQNSLGALHNYHVWRRLGARWGAKKTKVLDAGYLKKRCDREYGKSYELFLREWRLQQKNHTWKHLARLAKTG